MKKGRIIAAVVILLAVALVGAGTYVYATISRVADSDTVVKGVTVDGVDIGGMSRAEAENAVEKHEKKLADTEVSLTCGDKEKKVPLSDLGYSHEDVKGVVDQAYEMGKTGNVFRRYKVIREGLARSSDTELPVKKTLDRSRFKKFINSDSSDFVRKAQNATITVKDGTPVVTGGQTGMKVQVDENAQGIESYLNKKWDGSSFTYELKTEKDRPKYSAEDLKKVKDVLGTFTTDFSTSPYNRCVNIENACSKINGSIVYPGETFSVMDHIAPLSADNGYLEAGSYSQGEVIQSYGGGVCQVSTTLYNAVLASELEIVERHNHQMTVHYVDLSYDAAVSDTGNQDFKFRNNLDLPVYLSGVINGKTITFTVYGAETRPADRKVEFYNEQTDEIEPPVKKVKTPDLKKGETEVLQQGTTGYRAKLYKKVTENGKETVTEINSSYYAPTPSQVAVGTGKGKKKSRDDKSAEASDKKSESEKGSKGSKSSAASSSSSNGSEEKSSETASEGSGSESGASEDSESSDQ